MNKIKLLIILTLLFSFSFTFAEWEMETNWPTSPAGASLNSDSTLAELVIYFYEWAIILGIIATFGILVYASFLYITSSGNFSKLGDAKSKISSAFLGLALLLSSWILISLLNPELSIISNVSVPLMVAGEDFELDPIKTEEDLCDYIILAYRLRGVQEDNYIKIDVGDLFRSPAEPLYSVACKSQDGIGSDFSEKNGIDSILFIRGQIESTFDWLNPICDIECARDRSQRCEDEIYIEFDSANIEKECYDHFFVSTTRNESIKYISQKPDYFSVSCLAGDKILESGGGCTIGLYETTIASRCGRMITQTTATGSDIASSYDRRINCIDLVRYIPAFNY